MHAESSSDTLGWSASPPVRAPASARPDRVATTTEPRATILIVEDHDDSRDAMGMLITALGYRAILAGTGAEALTVLQRSRPDLILCDVRMPGMDGFTLVKTVRSQPDFDGVRFVAVTGLSDHANLTRMLQAGFDGYLVKPLDYDVLAATLDCILGMVQALSFPTQSPSPLLRR
jgi:CheY-like chemotaxis protein